MIERSPEISHRVDFSVLCNARGYKDAVEVGVDLGRNAVDFLKRFKGNWLFGVDPYLPHPDFPYDRSADMFTAVLAIAPYHGREGQPCFRLVKARSVDAAPWVKTVITPEFIYIDASHEEADVYADLVAWWAVLADHGMCAGHDYDADHPGVIAAVNRFAQERKLTIRLTHETTAPASFYLYKTEPPTLFQKLWTDGEFPNPHCPPGA